ncbi:hypothetical protein CI610_00156 [invertebrate metagenome]|uniref:Nudix hydrolase domain-containing protein n=1 Tax=invertebrate metagenome TaxID=1711999 RepID=A0A2H9TC83_9ZZZZ
MSREILEESGYKASATKLVTIRDILKHPYHPKTPSHIIKLLFLCELKSEMPMISQEHNNEISDVDYFSPNQLPSLSEGRTIKADINLLLHHRNIPSLPTEYD